MALVELDKVIQESRMRENLTYGLMRVQGKQDYKSMRPSPTLQRNFFWQLPDLVAKPQLSEDNGMHRLYRLSMNIKCYWAKADNRCGIHIYNGLKTAVN